MSCVKLRIVCDHTVIVDHALRVIDGHPAPAYYVIVSGRLQRYDDLNLNSCLQHDREHG